MAPREATGGPEANYSATGALAPDWKKTGPQKT